MRSSEDSNWRTDSSGYLSGEFETVSRKRRDRKSRRRQTPRVVKRRVQEYTINEFKIGDSGYINPLFYKDYYRAEDIRFFECHDESGILVASCTVFPSTLSYDIYPTQSTNLTQVYYPNPRGGGQFKQVNLKRVRESTLKIEDVEVSPEYRGQGLCFRFLSGVANIIKNNPELYHYEFLYINSYPNNIPARRCYNRLMQWPKRRNVMNTGLSLGYDSNGKEEGVYWITPMWAF